MKLTGAEDEVEVSHADLIADPRVVAARRHEGGIDPSHDGGIQILDRGGGEDPEIAELVAWRPIYDEERFDRSMSHHKTKRDQKPGCFRPGCLGPPAARLGDP